MTEVSSSVSEPADSDISLLKKLIDKGEYLKAYDLAVRFDTSLEPGTIELGKLHSITLSKLGMPEDAAALLESLRIPVKNDDWELEALLGSYYKKQWLRDRNSDRDLAGTLLRRSFLSYTRAIELGGDFWCAINASTLAKISGDTGTALMLAEQASEECWKVYGKTLTTSSFWIPATLGEAFLVREDFPSAIKWYRAARSHVGGNLGWLQSARSNAKLLLEVIRPDPETLNQVLDAIPRMRIALFAGHRLDEKGRASTRFPEDISDRVQSRLRKALVRLHVDMGIASAADGSDILFHETMQDMGKRTEVVLPYGIESFRKTIVDSVGENWGNRFDAVIRKADSIDVSSTGNYRQSHDFIHDFCSDYMLVSAVDCAISNDAELVPIVLWDGGGSGGKGGTADTVAKLLSAGLKPQWIKPGDFYGAGKQTGRMADLHPDGRDENVTPPTFPRIRPIVTICDNRSGFSEEGWIERAASLMSWIDSFCSTEDCVVLKNDIFHRGINLIFNRMDAAWTLASSFRKVADDFENCSLLIHAGVLVSMKTSLNGSRDSYCREAEEAITVCQAISGPSRICTMQARALSGVAKSEKHSFRFRGTFDFNDGRSLKLYEFAV